MRDRSTGAALLLVVVTLCIAAYVILGDRGGQSTAPEPAPAPDLVPVAGMPGTPGRAEAGSAVAELSRRIEQYHATHGAYPPTLDTLKSGGPLPALPAGMNYKYHNVTGRLEARSD